MGLESIDLQSTQSNPLDILKNFFNKENIELKSELTDEEISIMLECFWHFSLNENKQDTGLKILVAQLFPYLLALKTSRNRQSRKELKDILTSFLPKTMEQQNLKEELGI